MRTPLITTALAAGALIAGGAAARQAAPMASNGQMPAVMPMRGGGGGGGGMGGLMAADTNGDGIITRAEAVAAADARFDRLDVNHDGTLSADEMQAAMPMTARGGGAGGGGGDRGMAAMGPVTRAQYHDRALRPFDRIDANHDGRIDQTELAAYRDMMRARRQERRTGDGPPPPPPGAPTPPPGQ